MGDENYPQRILNIAIFGLLLFSGISMTMQTSEMIHQTETLKNVTGSESDKCCLQSFPQVWSRSGGKSTYIKVAFCQGMCYSNSNPVLHNRLVKVCKPAKWAYQEVTAVCFKNGNLVHKTKQIIKIHDYSCAVISFNHF